MFTEDQLKQIMPTLPAARREMYLPFLSVAMETYEIDNALRAAAFLAQLAHESGELKFMEEIWGPTAQQKRYEPPSDLAARLGNTEPGDGARFKGRGPIQITGRFNYRKYGDLLGVDLVEMPELAATPQIAFAIAGLFWQKNGLNALADRQDFTTITKRINGGLNGLASREKYYARALQVLATNSSRSRATRSQPAAPTKKPTPAQPTTGNNRLPRGQEAIEEVLGTAAAARRQPSVKQSSTKKAAVKSATKKVANKQAAQKTAKKSVKPTASAKPAAKQSTKKVATPRKATAKQPPQKAARKRAR
jgi:putative chitinase